MSSMIVCGVRRAMPYARGTLAVSIGAAVLAACEGIALHPGEPGQGTTGGSSGVGGNGTFGSSGSAGAGGTAGTTGGASGGSGAGGGGSLGTGGSGADASTGGSGTDASTGGSGTGGVTGSGGTTGTGGVTGLGGTTGATADAGDADHDVSSDAGSDADKADARDSSPDGEAGGPDSSCTPSPPTGDPGCPGANLKPCSFEDFKSKVLSLPPGSGLGGAFVVEGDLVINDESALRTHYDRYYAPASLDAALTPFEMAWTGDQKRNVNYCFERPSFGSEYEKISYATWAAAGAWEQIADVRFVNDSMSTDDTCVQAGAGYQFRIRRVAGAPYTILYAQNATGTGKLMLVGDAAMARPEHELHAVLRHALGHVLGLGHARRARSSSCTSTSCSDLDRLARWSSMRQNWCAEPIPDLLYPNQADAMPLTAAYDDPGSVLRAGADIYARKLSTREVFRFNNASWAKVGDATRSLTEVNGSLYRLTGNGEQIQVLQSPGDTWQAIGGPVNNILRCGSFLCAIDATDGSLLRYSNATWQRLGEPSRGYASTDTELFRTTADNQFVERYDEQNKVWVQIGASAGYVHAGPQFLYVTTPSPSIATLGTVMRWRPELADWHSVGGAGRLFVSTADGLWGVVPSWYRVWLLSDEVANNWTPVEFEFLRIEGRQELFALNFDGTIRRYRSGVWSDLGQPQ